jgi:hypothetical protein
VLNEKTYVKTLSLLLQLPSLMAELVFLVFFILTLKGDAPQLME